ncbi:MAG: glycosyltransferase family 2 protein [Phycisphaerales bacterium JB063]
MQEKRHNPTLSIGLPVYNGENYLEQAVRCLLAQTFADFELIICDNASTDRTQAICEAFAKEDGRVRYIRHPSNLGLIRNFNRAFEVSRGVYFKWMSHDDLIDEDFARRCVRELQLDADMVVCCTSTSVIDADGFILEAPEGVGHRLHDPLGVTRLRDLPGPERGLDHDKPHIRHHGVLLKSTRCYEEFGVIRSSALRKTPLREYYPGSEKVFLTELSLIGKIKVLPEPLMFMRVHDARLSSQAGSSERQALYLAPSEKKRSHVLPPQVRCAWGYWRAVCRQPLTFGERVRCTANVARFLFQVRKWGAILRIALMGKEPTVTAPAPTRGRRIETLAQPQAAPTLQPHPPQHA